MVATLKTRKGKSKNQAKIYEHTENLEPVATKEFVRLELEPIKRDIAWLRWVMGGGFALLLTVMIYLHSDASKRMDRIEERMDRIEERMGRIEDKLDRILQKNKVPLN